MQIKKHFNMNHVFFIQTRMVFKFLIINRRPLVLYIYFFSKKFQYMEIFVAQSNF